MRHWRDLILWAAAGALGIALLAAVYPRAFPFLPRHWSVSRHEAEAIALARLRDLGEPVPDPYVVTVLDSDPFLERRLQTLPGGPPADPSLADQVAGWAVLVYPRGAPRDEWTYMARVTFAGGVAGLRLQLDPKQAGRPIAPQAARDHADAFLLAQGVDLGRYLEPEVRSRQLAARTDLTLRYRDRASAAQGVAHGIEVSFAGDRLAGFAPWVDDPQQRQLQQTVQTLLFAGLGRLVLIYLVAALLAVPFLRRYHEGAIGVRRGVQIFLLVASAAVLLMLVIARAAAQGIGYGAATRVQTTWIYGVAFLVFEAVPICILAFLAWSVGESVCRERWGAKLAAFDALFQRDWANATVARSALRGTAAGCLLAGAVAGLLALLRRYGVSPLASVLLMTQQSSWPGIELLLRLLTLTLPGALAALLCLLPMGVGRLGRLGGAAVAVLLGGCLLFPAVLAVPFGWGLLVTLSFAVLPVALFLAYDLLTALLAGAVAQAL